MNTKTILTILTSLAATAVFALDAPQVGSAAPEISLTDAKGKTHSLADYKGK
jgi:peroxiredoxin